MINFEQYRHQIIYGGRWVSNWFSNMIIVDNLIIDGILYPSVENYYQSMKLINIQERQIISNLEPHLSKKEVRKYEQVKNWDDIKIDVMYKALYEKFSLPEWKEKLLKTKHEPIIEWNNWNDKFWGVTVKDNKGKNNLGILLMNIRKEFRYKPILIKKIN